MNSSEIKRPRLSERRSKGKTNTRLKAGLRTCLTCLGDFRPYASKPDQKFCETRCRRLYWSAVELVSAYEADQVPGLLGIIEKLRSMKGA